MEGEEGDVLEWIPEVFGLESQGVRWDFSEAHRKWIDYSKELIKFWMASRASQNMVDELKLRSSASRPLVDGAPAPTMDSARAFGLDTLMDGTSMFGLDKALGFARG